MQQQPRTSWVIRQVHLLFIFKPEGVVFLQVAHCHSRHGELGLVELPPQMLERLSCPFGVFLRHLAIGVNGPSFEVADLEAVFSAY